MAKRARGGVRPGQRRPIERRAAAPAAPAKPTVAPAVSTRPSGLTEAETARAAELEAALLAEERSAEQARRRTRDRAVIRDVVTPGGTLAKRAEEEYAYVARDVRDIARIAVIMLTILLALYILIDAAKVIPIG
jgi:hypothetical protein